MNPRLFLGAIASLLGYISPVQAQWIGKADVNYEFNENLSNAQLGNIKSDSAFRAKLSSGSYLQLADPTSLTLTADIGGTTYLRFDGLNNVSYGASTTLRHKFGVGGSVPWISASGSAAYHDFENAPRDGWRYNLSFTMGKRLSERWELQVGYRYEEHIADHIYTIPGLTQATFDEKHAPIPIKGDAFNIAAHSVSLTGIFTVTDKLTAYLTYTRREGGVTSTVGRDPEILEYADAIALDSAFGSGRYAYRTDASSNIFSLGLSWALTSHTSLNLGYKWMDCDVGYGLNYTNNVGQLNLLYSF